MSVFPTCQSFAIQIYYFHVPGMSRASMVGFPKNESTTTGIIFSDIDYYKSCDDTATRDLVGSEIVTSYGLQSNLPKTNGVIVFTEDVFDAYMNSIMSGLQNKPITELMEVFMHSILTCKRYRKFDPSKVFKEKFAKEFCSFINGDQWNHQFREHRLKNPFTKYAIKIVDTVTYDIQKIVDLMSSKESITKRISYGNTEKVKEIVTDCFSITGESREFLNKGPIEQFNCSIFQNDGNTWINFGRDFYSDKPRNLNFAIKMECIMVEKLPSGGSVLVYCVLADEKKERIDPLLVRRKIVERNLKKRGKEFFNFIKYNLRE